MEDNKLISCGVTIEKTNNNPTESKEVSSSRCLLVSPRQKGNPVLKLLTGVPWQHESIIPDYQMTPSSCALYLSLRYHNLNPSYIHERLKLLGNSYELRVLLVLVDTKDPHHSLKELGKTCLLADVTLLVSFSLEEAAKYLELFKNYENKSAEMIQEKSDLTYDNRFMATLTTVRRINRSDAEVLSSTLGNLANIAQTDEETLSLCPGIGVSKAKTLHKVLHQPFKKI